MEKDLKNFLDYSAEQYHNSILKGWEKLYYKKREYLYKKFKRFYIKGKALELGCADAVMTQKLCNDFGSVTVVDGSKVFLDTLKSKIKAANLKIVHSLFEEYETNEKYNTIFMSHILEHLDEPVKLLIKSNNWLENNGRLLVAVPNANSLHRLIGVKLGLLKSEESLNEQDIILGHKRVYTPDLLKQHITEAGFNIIYFGGLMV